MMNPSLPLSVYVCNSINTIIWYQTTAITNSHSRLLYSGYYVAWFDLLNYPLPVYSISIVVV